MTLRRVSALLLAIMLAHLNVRSTDSACAKHSTHDADVSQADAHEHGATHGAKNVVAIVESAGHDEPCDIPVVPRCCLEAVSCSALLAIDAASSSDDDPVLHAGSMGRLTAMPLSPVTSPDPPPPRA